MTFLVSVTIFLLPPFWKILPRDFTLYKSIKTLNALKVNDPIHSLIW